MLFNLVNNVPQRPGMEWGFWMNDYLVSRQLANPSRNFADALSDISSAFGRASGDVQEILSDLTDYQRRMLIDANMVPYFSAEDIYDDLGDLAGIITAHPRIPFETVNDYSELQLNDFVSGDLARLREMKAHYESLQGRLVSMAGLVPASATRFYLELLNCLKINSLRAAHSLDLYEAVVLNKRGDADSAKAALLSAELTRKAALAVVLSQETRYRYDLNRYIHQEINETVYPFGYLRQAHTLCFWERQARQAESVVDKGRAASFSDLPTCIE